jgi:hypothetical protein
MLPATPTGTYGKENNTAQLIYSQENKSVTLHGSEFQIWAEA